MSASALWADSYADRAAEVKALSAEKKAELLRKKERFDKLSDAEKNRLRGLHEQLASSPDGPELLKLMGRYCDWLKGLNPRERDEVLSLPADKRIARIKEIVSRQEGQRFTEYVNFHLPKPDQDAIYKWLDDFVAKHEEEILDQLSENERKWFPRIDDDRARRKALIPKLLRRRGDSNMPFPSSEETDQMVASLSAETRGRLDAPGGTDRSDRLRELVGAAILSVSIPPPSEDDLRKLFASLPAADKGRLEEMDPDEMDRALRFMYRARHIAGRGYRGGGPPGRGPGPPPPGFANPK
ncbi:MAG: hypothetical protein L0211_06175 [Planctomycetaceae bacterium]|nr:hypothetical protein [Planctomycetaceae bacterium]